jgi:hypothetical protein
MPPRTFLKGGCFHPLGRAINDGKNIIKIITFFFLLNTFIQLFLLQPILYNATMSTLNCNITDVLSVLQYEYIPASDCYPYLHELEDDVNKFVAA